MIREYGNSLGGITATSHFSQKSNTRQFSKLKRSIGALNRGLVTHIRAVSAIAFASAGANVECLRENNSVLPARVLQKSSGHYGSL